MYTHAFIYYVGTNLKAVQTALKQSGPFKAVLHLLITNGSDTDTSPGITSPVYTFIPLPICLLISGTPLIQILMSYNTVLMSELCTYIFMDGDVCNTISAFPDFAIIIKEMPQYMSVSVV